MKVTYAPEAIEDIVEALACIQERSPAGAAKVDGAIVRCIERLAARELDGPVSRLRSGTLVRSWGVPPFRLYYRREADELVILRVYHQSRRPIVR